MQKHMIGIMSHKYILARDEFKPNEDKGIAILFIAESPPSSGGYFYSDEATGRDNLFRETMKALALCEEGRKMPKGLHKRSLLERFKDMRFFVLDVSYEPVDKMPAYKRRFALEKEIPRLLDDVRELDPESIIIIKASIFAIVKEALEKAGFAERILNSHALPFPSHGNQKKYRDDLRKLIARAREKNSEKTIVLRPYQREILNRILEASATRSKILIALSVGMGRTVTIALALNELFRKGKIRKALILVPRLALLDQHIYSLNRHSSAYARISRLDGNTKLELVRDIRLPTVMVSTLAMFRKISSPSPDFDIIFLDEFHTLSEKDWAAVCNVKSSVVGFTALNPLEISPELLSLFGKQGPDYSYGMSSIKLRELADIHGGAAYAKTQLQRKGSWKFIRPRDIKQGGKLDVHTFISESVAKEKEKSALRVGDILLQNIFNFEKIAIVKEENLPAIASQNLFIIRSKKISPDLLFEHLQSKAIADAFRKQLEDLAHGATIKHVCLRDVGEIPVPLPFSKDQLSEFAGVKQLQDIGALRKARDELAQLRRAYLEFSGEE